MTIFPCNAVSVVRGVYLVIDGSTLEQTTQEGFNLSFSLISLPDAVYNRHGASNGQNRTDDNCD